MVLRRVRVTIVEIHDGICLDSSRQPIRPAPPNNTEQQMIDFIKLTLRGGEPLHFRKSSIIAFYDRSPSGSYLTYGSGEESEFSVLESPKEILKLLGESQ